MMTATLRNDFEQRLNICDAAFQKVSDGWPLSHCGLFSKGASSF